MKKPSATYRVQLSSSFRFEDLRKIIPYLDGLGINCIYASPIFVAREGSTHGYDVTNPLAVNPEIGSLEELRNLSVELKKRDMLWLQDVVPNHMAFDSSNPWIADILARGEASEYYSFFDIDWEKYEDDRKGKLMLPVLGEDLMKVVTQQDLKLKFDGELFFSYYEHRFPASQFSYIFLMPFMMSNVNGWRPLDELESGLSDVARTVEDTAEWNKAKARLAQLLDRHKIVKEALDKSLDKINSAPHLMWALLDQQHFFLTHWQTTESEINYRRFFTINDLICLRMEDGQVFEEYHRLIRQLCDEGIFDGLRIDHIDGLFDPQAYLEKLRQSVGEDVYVVVEKILEWDERIPLNWPVDGTSGYGFLAAASRLFTDPSSAGAFAEKYRELVPAMPAYSDLVFDKKLFIIHQRMGGELENLLHLLQEGSLWPEDAEEKELKEALAAYLSAFPVYRIYPQDLPLGHRQQHRLAQAYEQAREKAPGHQQELDWLHDIFLGKTDHQAEALYFLQRCQQFTGPLAAKGVEDTTFYIYNLHISRNEVGDSPAEPGLDLNSFHQRMLGRRENFPYAVNTTATHDTKRGEDARMRINALTDFPQEWFAKVDEWRKINRQFLDKGPDPNEEYFIYQALLGAWPVSGKLDESFLERTANYLQKVLREAKEHSNWSEPDEEYETSVFHFIKQILHNPDFRKSFDPFAAKLAFRGMIYSLGQSVLKVTAPGVPDVYQGTELWDLSYVDPDNRRPVDYKLRQDYLQQLPQEDLGNLKEDWADARIKQFVLHTVLKERRQHQEVFGKGNYVPLSTPEQVLGFMRQHEKNTYLVLILRQMEAFSESNSWPVGEWWNNQRVELPMGTAGQYQDLFTGRQLLVRDSSLELSDCFFSLPVAVLKLTGS